MELENWFSSPDECTLEVLQKLIADIKSIHGNAAKWDDSKIVRCLMQRDYVNKNKIAMKLIFSRLDLPPGFIKAAILEEGFHLLQYLPVSTKTPELLKAVVEKWPEALKCIPKTKRTKELCEIVLALNRSMIWAAGSDFIKSEEDAINLVHNRISPRSFRTLRVLKEMAGTFPHLIEDREWNDELLKIYVAHHRFELNTVPKRFQTKEFFKMLVQKDAKHLRSVPNADAEIYESAVTQNISCIQLIELFPANMWKKILIKHVETGNENSYGRMIAILRHKSCIPIDMLHHVFCAMLKRCPKMHIALNNSGMLPDSIVEHLDEIISKMIIEKLEPH